MTSVAGATVDVTEVAVKYQVFADGGCVDTCDDIETRIFIDGAYETAQTTAVTASDALVTETFTGTWTGDDDLRVELVRKVKPAGTQVITVITTISATTSYTVPSDWNVDNNSIEVIGGGGGGGEGSPSGGGAGPAGGGGGGAYAKITNLSLTPGPVTIQVGGAGVGGSGNVSDNGDPGADT